MNDVVATSPAIGEEGWLPSKVHPLAMLFPEMSEDDLAALALDISENGQVHPIIIDDEGVLIDGRMRLRACKIAHVEPWYEKLESGGDAETFIWSANGKRRHMSKGQMAMIAAMGTVLEAKADRDAHGRWTDEGKAKAARSAGVSAARISQALLVREHAPHLVDDVIAGKPGMTLDTAYTAAQANKREKDWRDNGIETLRAEDRDLAQKVADREMTLEQARAELEKKARERVSVRDSVLLGISHGVVSLAGFERSETLPGVAIDLKTREGLDHLKRYFPEGVKELGERIVAAEAGLAAVKRVYQQLNGGKHGERRSA